MDEQSKEPKPLTRDDCKKCSNFSNLTQNCTLSPELCEFKLPVYYSKYTSNFILSHEDTKCPIEAREVHSVAQKALDEYLTNNPDHNVVLDNTSFEEYMQKEYQRFNIDKLDLEFVNNKHCLEIMLKRFEKIWRGFAFTDRNHTEMHRQLETISTLCLLGEKYRYHSIEEDPTASGLKQINFIETTADTKTIRYEYPSNPRPEPTPLIYTMMKKTKLSEEGLQKDIEVKTEEKLPDDMQDDNRINIKADHIKEITLKSIDGKPLKCKNTQVFINGEINSFVSDIVIKASVDDGKFYARIDHLSLGEDGKPIQGDDGFIKEAFVNSHYKKK